MTSLQVHNNQDTKRGYNKDKDSTEHTIEYRSKRNQIVKTLRAQHQAQTLSFIDKSLIWNRQSKPLNFLPSLLSYSANLLQVKLANRTCVHWYMYEGPLEYKAKRECFRVFFSWSSSPLNE